MFTVLEKKTSQYLITKMSYVKSKNVKSIVRNGNLFCKHCKINGASLGGKMDR